MGFVFNIKKKKLLRNLNKRREYFTVREQTPRYKITTVWIPDLSHLLQSRDGEEIAETNSSFINQRLRNPTNMIKI